MNTIGERLRELRESVPDLTARELDRVAGRALGHTSAIEVSAGGLRTDVASAYAAALGCSLDWLVLGEGPRPTPAQVARAVNAARKAAA